MSGAARRFDRLKLNQKFTVAVFCVVLVPVAIAAVILFSYMKRVITEDKIKDIESGLRQVQTGVEKTIDLCNMTTQVFLNNTKLREFLISAKTGEIPSAEELLLFHRGEVIAFERMVNSNPYLYQVRVYYDNEKIPELMPIFYHRGRMNRLAWAEEAWQSGAWQYDYEDAIFPAEVTKPTQHLMSLVTVISDFEHGELGVLEVSVQMDEILLGLFGSGSERSACLVVDGGWYCDRQAAAFWEDSREALEPLLRGGSPEITTVSAELLGEPVYVTVAPLAQLGGQYVVVTPPGELTRMLGRFQLLFLLGFAGLLLLLAVSINLIVKAVLRRFYTVFGAITAVREEGNLDVAIPDLGDDEIGLLARQLNLMLARISSLMEENVNRQLLAKNSEIRALLSQINAHFIYNVLESIKMMAEVDEKYEIADALQSLGQLLRYSMRWSSANVSVAEEVANALDYLALINIRYDYRVILRSDLPEDILRQGIPRMVLQPIVENAVVHGIEELSGDVYIDLTAAREGGDFTLRLTDYGEGMDEAQVSTVRKRLAGELETEPGRSIGLKNAHDRIAMECGGAYGLTIDSRPGEFTTVGIRLPYAERKEGDDEHAAHR